MTLYEKIFTRRQVRNYLNSRPWKLDFQNGKIIIHDAGRGMKRIICHTCNRWKRVFY